MNESVKTTFENNSDIMPEGRNKVIHSVGWVSKIEYIPKENNSYTGILSRNSIGFIRGGLIQPIDTSMFSTTVIKVGISLKFMQTGVKSANVVAFNNPDGQEESDFFAHPMSNHV